MRNHEITSPSAAELYFNESIFGQLCTLFAETLGKTERSGRQAHPQRAQSNGHGIHPKRETAHAPTASPQRRTLFERVDAWFWRQQQEDREAYLARSRDVFELEQRIKALERGEIARYY